MAEVDDATVAARTKEILETDEAIKTQYGDGSLTVKTLRKAVAAALGAEESAIKKVVKSTLLAYMDEQEPQEEDEEPAAEEEEAEPAPKKEKKKKAKRTDRLTDKAALDAKLKEDNWQITEKPRPTKEGGGKPSRHVDKYYKKPGESKQYRSLLEIARAHYPEFLTGEPPAKKEKPQKEKKERAPRSAASKPEKKLELGKITKAGKGAASKAPPKRKERPPTPPPAKKPKPPPPEQVVNSAWASVPERVIAADKVLPKLVTEKNWDEIKKMLKMLGRDLGVPSCCGVFTSLDGLVPISPP